MNRCVGAGAAGAWEGSVDLVPFRGADDVELGGGGWWPTGFLAGVVLVWLFLEVCGVALVLEGGVIC